MRCTPASTVVPLKQEDLKKATLLVLATFVSCIVSSSVIGQNAAQYDYLSALDFATERLFTCQKHCYRDIPE
ncbi:hypothetical protein PsW64_01566 [Pseudovibrio sp. W64]|nr:hypothetical protein PsAD13_02410 [Pseudovibrio sp. Ad13]KZK85822.1 hypothetical protein PsW64_01566 [Pseudovibrio sp. W64]KZL01892.1 hypothetical protein PsAD26_04759 [Pseudovibrio sp. Ad26]